MCLILSIVQARTDDRNCRGVWGECEGCNAKLEREWRGPLAPNGLEIREAPPWGSGPASPMLVSRQSQTLGGPGRSKGAGTDGGASPSTPFGGHPWCTRRGAGSGAGRHALRRTRRGEGAKRSGGGSIELLGGPGFGSLGEVVHICQILPSASGPLVRLEVCQGDGGDFDIADCNHLASSKAVLKDYSGYGCEDIDSKRWHAHPD